MEHINDTLSGSPVAQLGYVQSLGGVSTYVRFTDRFVDELLAKVEEPYNSMVINRADLVWEIDDPDRRNFRPGAAETRVLCRLQRFLPRYSRL